MAKLSPSAPPSTSPTTPADPRRLRLHAGVRDRARAARRPPRPDRRRHRRDHEGDPRQEAGLLAQRRDHEGDPGEDAGLIAGRRRAKGGGCRHQGCLPTSTDRRETRARRPPQHEEVRNDEPPGTSRRNRPPHADHRSALSSRGGGTVDATRAAPPRPPQHERAAGCMAPGAGRVGDAVDASRKVISS